MADRAQRHNSSPRSTGLIPTPTDLVHLSEVTDSVRQCMERVLDGKPEVVRTAVVVLLAEGHLLIEDVPGVGKTMLAKALARSIDASVRRIQFTPDLLPSDVTGSSVINPATQDFTFRPGAVFANIVIGDEINRASPKTQSALLECMEERQVTVDGTTYILDSPFMVVATQNPVEMEGTYPLPEAQRDRFTARVSMGYPSAAAELEMLDSHGSGSPLEDLEPVAAGDEIAKLVGMVRDIYVADPVRSYIIDIVDATRKHSDVRLGASPRASLQLLRSVRASAALEGRNHVLPDDVQSLAVDVLAHRLILAPEAAVARVHAQDIVRDIISKTPVQTMDRR